MARLTKDELRKSRCRNGAHGTIARVENYTPEDIIINTYLHTDNEVALELAKKYEYMLLTAKLQPKKYIKERDNLFLDLAKWIHDNKLYREWVDFVYFVHSRGSRLIEILSSAYMSEMMESWNYLTGYDGTNIIGLTSQNELIIAPEYYGDWDIELHEMYKKLEKNKISKEKYAEFFFGPNGQKNFSTERNESLADIAIFGMIPYINERTTNIVPKDFYPHAEADRLTPARKWKPTEFYKEQLQSRKYLIDRKGIKLYLKNAGNWSEAMLMEDVTKSGQIVMLYRLSNPEGSTYGFYNLQDDYFFSCYKYSDGPQLHLEIENLILELYTEVVCGLEIDVKRAYGIQEVEDISNTEGHRSTRLFVQYQQYNEKTDSAELKGKRKGGHTQRPHERRYALRKLSGNRVASDEAIERAKELGIELQEGYTFVQSYSVGGLKDIRKEIKGGSK
ncbi:hypothetical protein [Paenibacillus xylanexedens]|uniref:hypothetical protein n=1 Tax=Paenibacillus xylanexedens TaxID=528191 RepID=UPI000F5449D6|nr:hypothetical protein [Paenibacillus xylanexedens]RPK19997.1 hypothetical protein EDO6_06514 [Paenibacillus xylanexedens]